MAASSSVHLPLSSSLLPPTSSLLPIRGSAHISSQKFNLYPLKKRKDSIKQTATNQPPSDLVSLTAAVTTHCRNAHLSSAAAAFSTLLSCCFLPSPITIVTFLSALADNPSSLRLHFGCSIHALVLKCYPVDAKRDIFLGTSLVDLYAKSGKIELARRMFDEMTRKNLVTWNTMIDGYMRCGDADEAMNLFRRMPKRDKVSWTSVIDGLGKNGRQEEALTCFREMQMDSVEVDYVTVIAAVSACADLGALGLGMWLQCYAEKKGINNHLRLSNALVDMYFRCGFVEFARQVFDKMPERTRVSWNSMIVGFAMNGLADDALEHFTKMQEEGFKPDGMSFTGALTACSHAGMVEEGLQYYNIMKCVHGGIKPRVEHFGCIVDLLSRSGRLDDAMKVVESMPMQANEVVLGSLLSACRSHGDVKLGENVMGRLLELKVRECDSTYVLLSNIYAAVERWDSVGEVRSTMKLLGIKKKPGFSMVEIDGNMYEFVAGEKSCCHSEEFYRILEVLRREMKSCGSDDDDAIISSFIKFPDLERHEDKLTTCV